MQHLAGQLAEREWLRNPRRFWAQFRGRTTSRSAASGYLHCMEPPLKAEDVTRLQGMYGSVIDYVSSVVNATPPLLHPLLWKRQCA